MNTSSVQESAKNFVVEQLKEQLNIEVSIDKLHFQPFNSVELNGLYIFDKQSHQILHAKKLYGSVDLYSLLRNKLVITAIRLNDFEVGISKETSDAPLNIQFLLDAFKSKDKDPNKKQMEIKIDLININNGYIKYDIKDKPLKENAFDANHIEVFDFNANISLKSLKEDSLNIQVKRLNLQEKSGFKIDDLIVRLISSRKLYQIKGFRLELPESLVQLKTCEIDLSEIDASAKNIADAKFNCQIASTHITPKDIAAFAPVLRNFGERIFLKTSISGSLKNLSVSNLSLEYEDEIQLVANASIQNVLDKNQLYLKGRVEKLDVSNKGIGHLINDFSPVKKETPKEIVNLGNVSFKGDISGYLKSLKARGLLNTALGAVSTDVNFGLNVNKNIESFFKGKVKTESFDLGKLTGVKDLDKLSFDLLVDLEKPLHKEIQGKVDGNIAQIDYKGYSYKNIKLDGLYSSRKVEGFATIDDENIYLDIDGLFDFSEKQPELNFVAKLRNLRADKLHLSEKYLHSHLSLSVNANFKGKSIDDINGFLSVDSIQFTRENKNIFIDKLFIEASGKESERKLHISSDIINGEVLGAYSYSTMLASFKQTFAEYLPSLITINKAEKKEIKENNFALDFTIKNTEKLSDIFSLPFTIYSDVKIVGFYNNLYERFKIEVFYPSAKVAGVMLNSGHLKAENSDGKINASISSTLAGKNNTKNDVTLDIVAYQDSLKTNIHFVNDSKSKFKGDFASLTYFSRKEKAPLNTDIYILPSDIILNDTLWQVNKSKISINSNNISVKDLRIYNTASNQHIEANGKYSKSNSDDVLKLNLKKINLEYLFNMLAIRALEFSGLASGTLQASSMNEVPYAQINLEVNNFGFNNTRLGNLKIFSELDDDNETIKITGNLVNDEDRTTTIDGFINPMKQKLSLDFDADRVDLAFLNKYSDVLFNKISGRGTGKVQLSGDFALVTVVGKAFIENASLGINFLNTRYSFTDTVYLKKDLIYFNNITLLDEQNNKAIINGKVAHDYFQNFMYYVDLKGSKFMLYNATEKQNPTFYGTVFTSGTGNVNGDERVVNINAQLKTESNTNVYMNFMKDAVNNYSFIKYKGHDSIASQTPKQVEESPEKSRVITTKSGTDINLNFYVDATPDATVSLIMDPVGGDLLKGSGRGALQFVWGSKTNPKLYGTYTIDKGSYTFTFQKIMERKFGIRSGSSVLFRGDPFQANLNIDAIYKLNANLNDLDADLATNVGQTNVPVECILNIKGELQHPRIDLDVALPSADAEVQRQVKSLMNTEDMVNRQMVYLLLLSKFYTPNYANTENKSSDFASFASATLSSQLTKILSTLDDRWQFGTNIRTSNSAFSSTEVELLMSSQLLDDRVLLNGNFGYRDNPQTSSSFIGDVDVEVLINKVGTWRLKAYNHYNEKYYYIKGDGSSAIQTQGLGIIYKKNFDYLREFFGQKPRYKMMLSDTIKPILPDSTIKGSSLGKFIKIKDD